MASRWVIIYSMGARMRKNKNPVVGIGERIRKARLEAGLTQEELAKLIKVKRSTIGMYEAEKNEPSLSMICLIAQALGKSVSWFFGEEERVGSAHQIITEIKEIKTILKGLEPEGIRRKIPLLGSIPASDWDYREQADVKTLVPNPFEHADFALRVQGDSMSPTIQHGDIVYVRRTQSFRHKSVVVAINEHREVTLKRVLLRRGEWVLAADNPAYEVSPASSAEVIGVVVGLVRQL